MSREYAYHCTNADPEMIKSHGFNSRNAGFTQRNQLQHFYDEFLPVNPMFVSDLDAPVWDSGAEHCLKVDIAGLQKFPDFGHLLDYGAQFDEECFWWEDEDELEEWRNSSDAVKRKLAAYVLDRCDYLTLPASQFTGDDSFSILGTCCVDGSKIDASRIVEAASR